MSSAWVHSISCFRLFEFDTRTGRSRGQGHEIHLQADLHCGWEADNSEWYYLLERTSVSKNYAIRLSRFSSMRSTISCPNSISNCCMNIDLLPKQQYDSDSSTFFVTDFNFSRIRLQESGGSSAMAEQRQHNWVCHFKIRCFLNFTFWIVLHFNPQGLPALIR